MLNRLKISICLLIFGGLIHDLQKTALEAAYYKGKMDKYDEIKPVLDAQQEFIHDLMKELKENEA